jgi:4-hydroxybutyrate CoA-transferase
MKSQTAGEALKIIKNGSRIFVHGGAATPNELLRALVEESNVDQCELMHLHTEGPALYADPDHLHRFRVANLFVGHNLRHKIDYDRIDYLPVFLSEVPRLFRSGTRPLDVALLHVSPPDAQGYCSLGVSVDVALAASETAKILIAQINPHMPRVHGDGFVHQSRFAACVEVDTPLPQTKPPVESPIFDAIAHNVAQLVEDGATLQTGIGAIPDAVLRNLRHLKHLGLHTEMWSDGALDLIEKGVIDNSQKKVHAGKSVSGFMMGSRRLYDFVHDNPSVIQLGIDYINFPVTIARNPRVTAINSALEVDLTGQVCADSLGHRIFSGVGGQMDFLRGAHLSERGRPIIALPSRTKNGRSRIVATLMAGAGVVTTRGHVRFVVTEYGVADLYGKTLSERATALAAIAHPEDRESLIFEWRRCRA